MKGPGVARRLTVLLVAVAAAGCSTQAASTNQPGDTRNSPSAPAAVTQAHPASLLLTSAAVDEITGVLGGPPRRFVRAIPPGAADTLVVADGPLHWSGPQVTQKGGPTGWQTDPACQPAVSFPVINPYPQAGGPITRFVSGSWAPTRAGGPQVYGILDSVVVFADGTIGSYFDAFLAAAGQCRQFHTQLDTSGQSHLPHRRVGLRVDQAKQRVSWWLMPGSVFQGVQRVDNVVVQLVAQPAAYPEARGTLLAMMDAWAAQIAQS